MIRRLDAASHETIEIAGTQGTGAVSFDMQGRLFGVQRTCTDSALPLYQSWALRTNIAILTPEHRVVANRFSDGRPLGRVNDVMADGKPWSTPPGVRNAAMTIYRLPMLAAGFKSRPK